MNWSEPEHMDVGARLVSVDDSFTNGERVTIEVIDRLGRRIDGPYRRDCFAGSGVTWYKQTEQGSRRVQSDSMIDRLNRMYHMVMQTS